MRVVIDTNVWVSRPLIAGSVPARAVDHALTKAEVVVSEAGIEELADVLSHEKWDHYVSLADREEFIRRVLQVTAMVPVLSDVNDCADPKDNKFLELAADSGAAYIVSGDKPLLALDPWRGIRIISPGDFLAMRA